MGKKTKKKSVGLIKRNILAILSLVMVISVVMPSGNVFAESSKVERESQNIVNSASLSPDLIKKVDQYIELNNKGQFEIVSEDKLLDILTPNDLEKIKSLIKSANETNLEVIKNDKNNPGTVTMKDNEVILSIKDSEIDGNSSEIQLFSSGVTKVTYHWWGMNVYLSKKVINAASAAGIGAAGYIASKLKVKHPVGVVIAAALGAAGYLGTQIPHGVKLKVSYTFAPPFLKVSGIGYQ